MESYIERILRESELLAEATIPRCLCMNELHFKMAQAAGCGDWKAFQQTVVCDIENPLMYVVLPLPPSLCVCSVSVDVLLAFILPPSYPSKPPVCYMLTEGVFIASSASRGSRAPVRLRKVPWLCELWIPDLTLRLLSSFIMAELSDQTKWETYFSAEDRKKMLIFRSSCQPSTLYVTLGSREWIPTPMTKLGRQWREMRVGRSRRQLPEVILRILEAFIGRLDFMLTQR